MTTIKLHHTTSASSKPLRGGTSCLSTRQQEASPAHSTPATTECSCPKTSSRSPTIRRPSCSESIIYEGRINSSQDGIVINARGIALTHTAGHGNCPKILIEYE